MRTRRCDGTRARVFRIKLLTLNDVAEALATAKENGILEEISYEIDSNKHLVTNYRLTEFGKDMIERYLR